MAIDLDEESLRRRLAPRLDRPDCRRGLAALAADPFFVAFFLASVSQGEGLGEAAVGMIGQEEVARLILDLRKQELEERGHKQQTLAAARDLFPEHFDGPRYRYEPALMGRPYYVSVLEANRRRLKDAGRHSRLNLYLTTTFGYEVMVVLLYRAVADAVAASALPAPVRRRTGGVLERILREEEGHLGVIDQHNRLLVAPRGGLSGGAREMLQRLEALGAEDYEVPAEDSVDQVVRMMARYAEPERYRAEIESCAAAA